MVCQSSLAAMACAHSSGCFSLVNLCLSILTVVSPFSSQIGFKQFACLPECFELHFPMFQVLLSLGLIYQCLFIVDGDAI